MRKIKTKVDLEKKKKKNQLILGIIMVFLLTASTLGYSLMSKDDENDSSKVTERGLDFYRTNGRWQLNIEGQTFHFQNLPSEIQNIEIEGIYSLSSLAGQPIYFNEANEGISEVLINLDRYLERYQETCIEGQNCTKDLPTKNCTSNILISIPGNSTRVYREENCIYLSGDYVKAADAFLYKTFGII